MRKVVFVASTFIAAVSATIGGVLLAIIAFGVASMFAAEMFDRSTMRVAFEVCRTMCGAIV